MKHYSALFLLMAVALSGCVSDNQRPSESAESLQYQKLFEAGRRAEAKGDVRIAGDTYGWLIGRGSRYGEYGLAMLQLRREPGSVEAAKYLIACAKRSSHTSSLFPDTAMDSAFSIAAMAKLADLAISEHDREDVAASLRSTMADVVTQEVRAWASEMKANADSASIYREIISAVESCRQSREYVKVFKWTEISDVFTGAGNAAAAQSGGKTASAAKNAYSVVKFVKTPGATCQYDFEVRLNGNGTFEIAEKIRSEIRRQLVKEFLAANPNDGVNDIRTTFLAWNQLESTINGSAVVMKVSAVRLEYDESTGRGKIAVRLDGRDVGAARKWAIENIEELATGKNIALVAGMPPPAGAHYRTGNERKTEDGLLEIEFTTYE